MIVNKDGIKAFRYKQILSTDISNSQHIDSVNNNRDELDLRCIND